MPIQCTLYTATGLQRRQFKSVFIGVGDFIWRQIDMGSLTFRPGIFLGEGDRPPSPTGSTVTPLSRCPTKSSVFL